MFWRIFVFLAVFRATTVSSVEVINAWNYCGCSYSRNYECKDLQFGSQDVSFNISTTIYGGNLHIENSNLYTIPQNAFLLTYPCETFGMVQCNLTHLYKWNFEGGNQTSSLNLESNRIRVIPRAVFEYLRALKNLYLRNNSISTLEPNCFFGLGMLETLDLEDNTIKFIPEDTFRPLGNLTILGLANNQIDHLPETIFAKNSFLQYVFLQNNKLIIIDPQTPDNLQQVFAEPVDMTSTAFLRLPNALGIYLTGNYMPYISNTTFSELKKLQFLFLNRTNISHMEPSSFSNLHSLVLLSLAENNLETFNLSLLIPLGYLGYVELHGNKLEHLDYEVLSKIPNLSSITLSNNSWTCTFQKSMNDFLVSKRIHSDLTRDYCLDETSALNMTTLIVAILGTLMIIFLLVLVLWYVLRRRSPSRTYYIVQMTT